MHRNWHAYVVNRKTDAGRAIVEQGQRLHETSATLGDDGYQQLLKSAGIAPRDAEHRHKSMINPNPWDWELESQDLFNNALHAYAKTYGHDVSEISRAAGLTAIRLSATAYRMALERSPSVADIQALLTKEYEAGNLAWLVENVERRHWTDPDAKRTAKEIARWYKQEWRENNDISRFRATLHYTVRDNVKRLIEHFAESLGRNTAATPLKQLAPGSAERRATAERLNIQDPRDHGEPASDKRFGTAFAEALENRAAGDGASADMCRIIAWAARQALKNSR